MNETPAEPLSLTLSSRTVNVEPGTGESPAALAVRARAVPSIRMPSRVAPDTVDVSIVTSEDARSARTPSCPELLIVVPETTI